MTTNKSEDFMPDVNLQQECLNKGLLDIVEDPVILFDGIAL
jgi:hypothetical protein